MFGITNPIMAGIRAYLVPALITLLLVTGGFAFWWIYNKGYHSAEAEWTIKLEQEKLARAEDKARWAAEIIKEKDRQDKANAEAKRAEKDLIDQLVLKEDELELLRQENEDAAKADPDANRVGISDAARMRLDAIR